jgi:hypothetical protein
MIISDIDHLEEVTHASDAEGGWMDASFWQPFSQSLQIFPAASASVINYGTGTSTGNTAISFNISMPVMLAINMPTARMSSRSSMGGWGSSSGRGGRAQSLLAALLFQSFFGGF